MVLRSSIGDKIAKNITMFKNLQQAESGDIAGLLASIVEQEKKLKVYKDEFNGMGLIGSYDSKIRHAHQTCPGFNSNINILTIKEYSLNFS
jgi:hypothetical protein